MPIFVRPICMASLSVALLSQQARALVTLNDGTDKIFVTGSVFRLTILVMLNDDKMMLKITTTMVLKSVRPLITLTLTIFPTPFIIQVPQA